MKKIYIITPVTRVKNLSSIFKSINWKYIHKWLIIYDNNVVKDKKYFFKDNSKIIELFSSNKSSVKGSWQRNIGINFLLKIKKIQGLVYFLDDDNIIHPNFYNICKFFKNNLVYTFDQQVKVRSIRTGNNIMMYHIDTAMFIVDISLLKNIRWKMRLHETDYFFLKQCIKNNNNSYLYINKIGCYYNYLSDNLFKRNLKKLKIFIYNNIIKF